MVDVVHEFESKSKSVARESATAARNTDVSVSVATVSALSSYRALSVNGGVSAPPQGAAWTEGWIAETKPDVVLAILKRNGDPVFILALEVVRQGPFRIARFMGGTHANGNFALAQRSWLAAARNADIRAVVDAIAATRRDIDMILLERLLPEMQGLPNPLLFLPHFNSPNLSLAVDLEGGFEGVLSRTSGKRKRKKHRSQTRKFETAGGHRRLTASTVAEVDRLLEAFFTMKEARFRKAGIHNVFGAQTTQSFFRTLFVDALAVTPPPFVLHGLEVGGSLRAVTGASRRGDTLICEFGAIVEDELSHASPGDFLFFDNISEACDQGFVVYDFSVGDEPYKRQWCDIETRHFDAVAALTLKGRALALGLMASARVKAYVKNSPLIWKITKALRRRAAGQVAAPAESSQD